LQLTEEQNEEMMVDEEQILNGHVECVKEEAKLLTREGEIINRVQNAITQGEDFDMQEYLATVEEIAISKMRMYEQLVQNIDQFKTKYQFN